MMLESSAIPMTSPNASLIQRCDVEQEEDGGRMGGSVRERPVYPKPSALVHCRFNASTIITIVVLNRYVAY
jgi:hypothetical protein